MNKVLNRPLSECVFVVFDLETTGGNPTHNGITEVCAIRYDRPELRFHTLVNPRRRIPPIVRKMTGITDAMVRDQPTIDLVMPALLQFIGDSVLVAHNAQGDMIFLRYFAERQGLDFENHFVCTQLLANLLLPDSPRRSLGALTEFYKLKVEGALHRASADAELTVKLFDLILQKAAAKGIHRLDQLMRFQGDRSSSMLLGWGISPRAVQELPAKSGVLKLHDTSGRVILAAALENMRKDVTLLTKEGKVSRTTQRISLRAQDLSYEIFPDYLTAKFAEFSLPESTPRAFPSESKVLQRIGRAWHLGEMSQSAKEIYAPVLDHRRMREALKSCSMKDEIFQTYACKENELQEFRNISGLLAVASENHLSLQLWLHGRPCKIEYLEFSDHDAMKLMNAYIQRNRYSILIRWLFFYPMTYFRASKQLTLLIWWRTQPGTYWLGI